jgi:hypothetical protein
MDVCVMSEGCHHILTITCPFIFVAITGTNGYITNQGDIDKAIEKQEDWNNTLCIKFYESFNWMI